MSFLSLVHFYFRLSNNFSFLNENAGLFKSEVFLPLLENNFLRQIYICAKKFELVNKEVLMTYSVFHGKD